MLKVDNSYKKSSGRAKEKVFLGKQYLHKIKNPNKKIFFNCNNINN